MRVIIDKGNEVTKFILDATGHVPQTSECTTSKGITTHLLTLGAEGRR